MPQVFCLRWLLLYRLDSDPDLVLRHDGISLHLTEGDAKAFAEGKQSANYISDPNGAHPVEVDNTLREEIWDYPHGMQLWLPRETAFPQIGETSKKLYYALVGTFPDVWDIYSFREELYGLDLNAAVLQRPSGEFRVLAVLSDEETRVLRDRGFTVELLLGPDVPARQADDHLEGSWKSSKREGDSAPPTPQTADTLSRTVGGRYKLTSLIQRLECGEAFAAQDVQTGNPYIVKIGALSEWAPAFRRAHEAAVVLGHGAFVRSVEFGLLDDQRPYLVEEPVQGSTLYEVRRKWALTPNQAFDIIEAVAEGLSAAHRQGVFWFDFAPLKTMLRKLDGQWLFHEPKLTDSLLSNGHLMARAPDEMGEGTIVGSAYQGLSPEEVSGKKKNPATDVYRLGSLGFFALVGRLPFEADNVTTNFFRIVHDEAAFPEEALVPALLQDLILHCLKNDPKARPPDGQTALEAILEVRRKLG